MQKFKNIGVRVNKTDFEALAGGTEVAVADPTEANDGGAGESRAKADGVRDVRRSSGSCKAWRGSASSQGLSGAGLAASLDRLEWRRPASSRGLAARGGVGRGEAAASEGVRVRVG